MKLSSLQLTLDLNLLILYFLSKKVIKKFRVLLFLLILGIGFYVQTTNDSSPSIVIYTISVHEEAFISAVKVLLRIIILISLSALLTLTTKRITKAKSRCSVSCIV